MSVNHSADDAGGEVTLETFLPALFLSTELVFFLS